MPHRAEGLAQAATSWRGRDGDERRNGWPKRQSDASTRQAALLKHAYQRGADGVRAQLQHRLDEAESRQHSSEIKTLKGAKSAERAAMPEASEKTIEARAFDSRLTLLFEGDNDDIIARIVIVADALLNDVHIRHTASREALYKAIASIFAVTQQLTGLSSQHQEAFLRRLPRRTSVKSTNIEYRVCMGLFDLPSDTPKRRTNAQKQISDYARVLEQASFENLSPTELLLRLKTRGNGIRAMATRASARRAADRGIDTSATFQVNRGDHAPEIDAAVPFSEEAPQTASDKAGNIQTDRDGASGGLIESKVPQSQFQAILEASYKDSDSIDDLCIRGWKVFLARKKPGTNVFTIIKHVNIGSYLSREADSSEILAAAKRKFTKPISLHIKVTPKVGR